VASRPPIWTPLGAALGRVLRAAAALAGVGLMVWYKWQPHQFHWPREGVAACIAGWVRIPFYNQYWNTEYAATVQVAQDFAAPLALAVILVSLMRRLGRPGRVAAAVLAAGIGAGIEAGQMFFPPRAADLTTVFIAVAGGVVGVYLYDPLVRVFVKPPAVEDEADGPWSPT
jgi:VanZ family protein